MRVTRLAARDFRNYERAEVELGERMTVIVGPNGAGKTNLLEAIYFGSTGRSPRTSNDRDLVRRGATAARVTVGTIDDSGTAHELEAAFQPGEPKLLRVDGSPVDNLWATAARPLISVFLPERLELIKGAPANRRAHLDQLVAALWPARAAARTAYSRALAQRNALLGRIRAGAARRGLARRLGRRAGAPRNRAHGRTLRGGRAARARASPSAPPISACPTLPRSPTDRAPRRRPPTSWRPSWPSATPLTSTAASPLTVRIATTCAYCTPASRCAASGRRVSSASACSRCCSPSATCSPPSATGRR